MAGTDDFMRHQDQNIDRLGWAVIFALTYVFPHPGDTAPTAPFAYTVGLTAHEFPELVITALDAPPSHVLLNDLATRVWDRNERFTHGTRITDLIAGYDAIIVDGEATSIIIPRAANARYGADQVKLQQVVWPDPQGRFPWDLGYGYDQERQPLIGKP
ncbi:DUF4262 domain-containing protein [Plantactinospora sp. CA-290183]|uniref:DUF4262 domain-containing protein n=1 Tax=Plantactinospora sp. CA-290183 TaxID=3240006 RepID=UPI003D8F460D